MVTVLSFVWLLEMQRLKTTIVFRYYLKNVLCNESKILILRIKHLKSIKYYFFFYIHEVDLDNELNLLVPIKQQKTYLYLCFCDFYFVFLFVLGYKDNGVKFFPSASGRLRTARPTC